MQDVLAQRYLLSFESDVTGREIKYLMLLPSRWALDLIWETLAVKNIDCDINIVPRYLLSRQRSKSSIPFLPYHVSSTFRHRSHLNDDS